MKRNEHNFNTQINTFFIPEHKQADPFKDGLFDQVSH